MKKLFLYIGIGLLTVIILILIGWAVSPYVQLPAISLSRGVRQVIVAAVGLLIVAVVAAIASRRR